MNIGESYSSDDWDDPPLTDDEIGATLAIHRSKQDEGIHIRLGSQRVITGGDADMVRVVQIH